MLFSVKDLSSLISLLSNPNAIFTMLMSLGVQMLDSPVHWPDGDDLAKVQLVIVNLCDEYCCHSLVESSAIHIDGGTHREHKADDAAVNVVVLQEALECYRQCGRAEEQDRELRALKGQTNKWDLLMVCCGGKKTAEYQFFNYAPDGWKTIKTVITSTA